MPKLPQQRKRKNRRVRLKTLEAEYITLRLPRKNDRLCIATGEVIPPDRPALKFVRSPDGTVVPDLGGKLPGRGAWVGATAEAVAVAVQKGLFARAFKQQAEVQDGHQGLIAQVREGLEKRALDALGLAKKSGGVISGFEKVRAGLKKCDFIAYIHASDGAVDGLEKVRKIIASQSEPCRIVGFFSGPDLDQALGSMNVVHLGLARGRSGSNFLKEVDRLSGFIPKPTDTYD